MIPSTHPAKKITRWTARVQHVQGEDYQQPITFRRVSQSGQLEIKIEYLYTIPNTYNLVYLAELDNVVP